MSTKATHRVVYILVYGINACAIFDMLRYDRCCPASEAEAALLNLMCNHHAGDARVGGRAKWVVLARTVSLGAPLAPSDRWRTFGWKVFPKHFTSIDRAEFKRDELQKKAEAA